MAWNQEPRYKNPLRQVGIDKNMRKDWDGWKGSSSSVDNEHKCRGEIEWWRRTHISKRNEETTCCCCFFIDGSVYVVVGEIAKEVKGVLAYICECGAVIESSSIKNPFALLLV